MPIYRTALHSNFTLVNSAIANTPMPFRAKDILLHLIEKPEHWAVIKAAICKQLQLSKYIVDKSLQWLREQGYAFYRSSKRGGGTWHIFDTPQPTTPVNTPHLVMPDRATPAPLVNTNKDSNTKKLQHTASAQKIRQTKPVVVSLEKEEAAPLVFPSGLNEPQRKNAKARIKKAPLDMQQAILMVLAANMAKGTVKNPIGYLNNLITSAHAGTFSPVDSSGGAKIVNPGIERTQAIVKGRQSLKRSKPDILQRVMSGLRAAL